MWQGRPVLRAHEIESALDVSVESTIPSGARHRSETHAIEPGRNNASMVSCWEEAANEERMAMLPVEVEKEE